MLDLQPGVHLHEEELVGTVGGDDELDGARADVADRARRVDRGGPDSGPGRGVQQRRRRLFDDLLVPPLQAALALAEVHHVAVRIGQHLYFDVPRPGDEALDEQRVVAESRPRLPARGGDLVVQAGLVVDQPHALAAAARGGLEQHRESDLDRGRVQVGVGHVGLAAAGHHRYTGRGHRLLGADLVAHRLDRAGRRADERDARLRARLGEARILGEEPVAGVDRLGTGAARGVQDALAVQVALARRARSDVDRRIGLDHMPRVAVGVAEHRDGADPQPPQRPDHPHRDLAPVRHQHRVEVLHRHPFTSPEVVDFARNRRTSHPENAVGDRFQRRVGGRRDGQTEDRSGLLRVDDAVVP